MVEQKNVWYLLITLAVVVLAGRFIMRKLYPRLEGFAGMERYQLMEQDKVYDDFYTGFYDQLMYSREKNEFEFEKISEFTDLSNESRVLDIGSGTGHHLQLFSENGVQGIGIDSSPSMVEYSSNTYPDLEFQEKLAVSGNLPDGAFTHALCLYFTIYYIKDKRKVFKNCFRWLAPGGYLVLHLVNKNKFNPVVPGSNKVRNVNVQKYIDGRITKSVAKVGRFNYTSDFHIEDPDHQEASLFEEKFTDHNGKVRHNKHTMYMETQSEILHQVRDAGFILDTRIDMARIGYAHQYLYIFQKPE